MEKLLIDVRTREEFVMGHIKGAICMPHYDLGHYADFLKGKEISLYCNTERRSVLAREKLAALGIEAGVIPLAEQGDFEWVEGSIVCAMNLVTVRPGHEELFMEKAMQLCRLTEHMEGFLGSKSFRASGISAVGSFLEGDLRDVEPKPARMVLLTYWVSKEAHERSHADPEFKAIYGSLAEHLAAMPLEEFCEVLK